MSGRVGWVERSETHQARIAEDRAMYAPYDTGGAALSRSIGQVAASAPFVAPGATTVARGVAAALPKVSAPLARIIAGMAAGATAGGGTAALSSSASDEPAWLQAMKGAGFGAAGGAVRPVAGAGRNLIEYLLTKHKNMTQAGLALGAAGLGYSGYGPHDFESALEDAGLAAGAYYFGKTKAGQQALKRLFPSGAMRDPATGRFIKVTDPRAAAQHARGAAWTSLLGALLGGSGEREVAGR